MARSEQEEAMQLTELEEMANDDPAGADAAIHELVIESNVEELSRIAEAGRVQDLKERAIDALGEVGGPEASTRLIGLLELANTEAVEGGTEQKLEHERMRAHLVRSLSRARGVRPPDPQDRRAVAEFIEDCRAR